MLSTREIIILANSAKKGGHCVAGKDIKTSEWIRPVSSMCPRASNLATPRIFIWPVDALSFGHLTHPLFGRLIDMNARLSYH